MLKKFIGDKAFYRRVFMIAIPIIIQNGITNFVSLLDNIMIGQVGTVQMSGVAIVNQLMFVFNLCIFGATSGAGIFTAQFFGSKDDNGVRYTFRFKILIGTILTALGLGAFLFFGTPLIQLYLQGGGNSADATSTLSYGLDYLKIMLWGLLPFAISNAYSGTLRECNQSTVPMIAGVCAVFVNLILNYVLIFGHFGAPAMGVRGAAVATVISRYVELAIVAGWTHMHTQEVPYIIGAYRSMRIPGALTKQIIIKGMPLLINEALWSTGMALINQSYSTRGLDVVAATNISSTLNNLSSIVYLAMGNVVGIIVGQLLGSGADEKTVRDTDRKLIFTTVASCLMFGCLMAAFSGAFPLFYNTTQEVRDLATVLICITAACMPFHAFAHGTYFTLRSGGQTMVTFLFDSCFVWVCSLPLSFCLSRFTGLPIIPMFAICQSCELLKCALGAYMLRKGTWIQNLVQQ